MNKTVKQVFLLIGILVLIFLIWQLVFNKGGIIKTGYMSLANGINKQWAKVAGSGATILPQWGTNNVTDDANGQGFEIDRKP